MNRDTVDVVGFLQQFLYLITTFSFIRKLVTDSSRKFPLNVAIRFFFFTFPAFSFAELDHVS